MFNGVANLVVDSLPIRAGGIALSFQKASDEYKLVSWLPVAMEALGAIALVFASTATLRVR